MCGAHATVRGFIGELVNQSEAPYDVLIDMEAGLEHLSRGTGCHVSTILGVVEPYYRSMETLRRIAELARELGVTDVQAILNKARDEADRSAVLSFCDANRLPVAGEIPYDPTIAAAERAGRPPVDFNPDAPAVQAIRALADRLLAPV